MVKNVNKFHIILCNVKVTIQTEIFFSVSMRNLLDRNVKLIYTCKLSSDSVLSVRSDLHAFASYLTIQLFVSFLIKLDSLAKY